MSIHFCSVKVGRVVAFVLSLCLYGGCSQSGTTQLSAQLTSTHEPSNVTYVNHSDPQELFKLVLAEQERCQRKLAKMRFNSRQETRIFDPYERVTDLRFRTVIRDGDSAWCDLYIQPGLLAGAPSNGIARMYFAWDGHLYFCRGEGVAGGQMCEYSPHSIPEDIAPMMRSGADVFPEQRCAYGTSKYALSMVADLDPQKYASHFEAERIVGLEGQVLYILKGWLDDRVTAPSPVWELTVDPAKGYMVISGQNQEPKGRSRSTFAVTPKEIAPGIWFPAEWEIRSYGGAPNPITGERQLGSILKYTISAITLNPPIDENQFTWKALRMSSGDSFMKAEGGGQYSMWAVVNGELKMQYKTTPEWHEYLKPFNTFSPGS